MNGRDFLGVIVINMLLFSCTNGDVCAPAAPPGLPDGAPDYCGECRANMVSIAEQCIIYYAANNTYPETLFQLGPSYAGLTCPECQSSYTYRGDQSSFLVGCPMPGNQCHGWIVDGFPSWSPGGTGLCRSQMSSISSMCVIFFAGEGRYPDGVEELGPPYSLMVCPKCGMGYTLFSFENPPGCDNFVVACPDPTDPNHGDIRNGIASWNP